MYSNEMIFTNDYTMSLLRPIYVRLTGENPFYFALDSEALKRAK